MVSSVIWEKNARVSFSKMYKIARVRRTSYCKKINILVGICVNQIRLLQNFALLLHIFPQLLPILALLVQIYILIVVLPNLCVL